MTLAAGSVLGSYRIIRLLGEGGMGCVYEAEHVGLKVRRALKVFSTESEHGDFLRKRFVAEGRILADLQHPRIVRVYDFAVDEATGTPYFAMDLVVSPTGEPQTLEKACRDGVDEEQVAGWFRDICEGLGYIHGKGIVHRDISLDNILIDPEGRAVLTDFGIAKVTGESYRRKIDVTVTMLLPVGEGLRMGKGLYMAPELKTGAPATVASDAYAVGVILFRLLVGTWYTPSARLEDSLAGLERYDWRLCLEGLLAQEPNRRMTLDAAVGALVPVLIPAARSGLIRRISVGTAIVLIVVAVIVILRKLSEPLPVDSISEPPSDDISSVTNAIVQSDGVLWFRGAAEVFIAAGRDSYSRISFIENLRVWGEEAIPAIVMFLTDKDEDVRSEACAGIVYAYSAELKQKGVENDPALVRRIVQDVFKVLNEIEDPIISLKDALDLIDAIDSPTDLDVDLEALAQKELSQAATEALARFYEKMTKQPFATVEAAREWCEEQETESDSTDDKPSDESE